MISARRPTQDEFLAGPIEEVVRVAPATMFYLTGGTRRHAVFSGVPAQGDEYARWTREHMIATSEVLFRHGICHLFMMTAPPDQFNEITPNYREHLWRWIEWGLAGPEAVKDYRQHGWRVRILFSQHLPQLREGNARLEAETPRQSPHTLWLSVIPDLDLPWRCLVEAIQQADNKSRAEVIRALYGEDIPPATLYLGTGKPVMSALWLPPLLADDKMQCYWSQRVGYSIDEQQFRTILYDYAYLRQTWQEDKSGRAVQALPYRSAWQRPITIGLGMHLGSYWYPLPLPPPPAPELPE